MSYELRKFYKTNRPIARSGTPFYQSLLLVIIGAAITFATTLLTLNYTHTNDSKRIAVEQKIQLEKDIVNLLATNMANTDLLKDSLGTWWREKPGGGITRFETFWAGDLQAVVKINNLYLFASSYLDIATAEKFKTLAKGYLRVQQGLLFDFDPKKNDFPNSPALDSMVTKLNAEAPVFLKELHRKILE